MMSRIVTLDFMTVVFQTFLFSKIQNIYMALFDMNNNVPEIDSVTSAAIAVL